MSIEQERQTESTARPERPSGARRIATRRAGVLAATAVLALGAGGTAWAAGAGTGGTGAGKTAGDGTDTTRSGAPARDEASAGRPDGRLPMPPHGGIRGFKHGLGHGPVLHGEFVVTKEGGGTRTVATQHGKVTEVGDDKLTVRSDDGFTRTYATDDDTRVNSGRQGLASIRKDATVMVAATIAGNTATAQHVTDLPSRGGAAGAGSIHPPAPGPGGGPEPVALESAG
jgi:hypothetical protein